MEYIKVMFKMNTKCVGDLVIYEILDIFLSVEYCWKSYSLSYRNNHGIDTC